MRDLPNKRVTLIEAARAMAVPLAAMGHARSTVCGSTADGMGAGESGG
ncbi:hypothetical protein ACWKT5_25295 [Streptomyces avermitilis]